jgi:gliding motility-associated-like protein
MQGNGSVSVLAMSDYPPVSYYWSTGATGASTIQNLSAGIYSLTVTDALGCTSSLSGIEVVNIPPPEISVVSVLGAINGADGSIDIDVPSHYGSYSVEWFFNSMDNPLPQFSDNISINGLDSGYYYVMVTDDACSTVAQIEVHQLYFGQGNLYIPNTITPSNDDGINDYFQLYYYGTVLFKEVLIYNRWGELVFTSNNINFKWNGVVNGKVAYNNVYNVLLYYYDYRGTEHVIRSFLLVL